MTLRTVLISMQLRARKTTTDKMQSAHRVKNDTGSLIWHLAPEHANHKCRQFRREVASTITGTILICFFTLLILEARHKLHKHYAPVIWWNLEAISDAASDFSRSGNLNKLRLFFTLSSQYEARADGNKTHETCDQQHYTSTVDHHNGLHHALHSITLAHNIPIPPCAYPGLHPASFDSKGLYTVPSRHAWISIFGKVKSKQTVISKEYFQSE